MSKGKRVSWVHPYQSIFVHPIGHRDMLVMKGYIKEKANKIILEMAKEQGFSKERLEELNEGLEKNVKSVKTDKMVDIVLDNGLKKQIEESRLSDCPDCGKKGVRGKEMCEGGGVTCIYCDYWFCY